MPRVFCNTSSLCLKSHRSIKNEIACHNSTRQCALICQNDGKTNIASSALQKCVSVTPAERRETSSLTAFSHLERKIIYSSPRQGLKLMAFPHAPLLAREMRASSWMHLWDAAIRKEELQLVCADLFFLLRAPFFFLYAIERPGCAWDEYVL